MTAAIADPPISTIDPDDLGAYLDPPDIVVELVRRARERLDADLRVSDADWLRIDDALDRILGPAPLWR